MGLASQTYSSTDALELQMERERLPVIPAVILRDGIMSDGGSSGATVEERRGAGRGGKSLVEPAISMDAMRELLEVSRQLAVTSDIDHLLPVICRSAVAMLECDRSSLYLYDAKSDQLWTKVALGAGEIRIPSNKGFAGEVFQSRKMLSVPDAYADPRFNPAVDIKTGYTTRNLLTLPVFDLDGHAVAVLQMINKNGGRSFSSGDEMLGRLLADQAGVAIQRFHLQRKALEAAALQKEMDLARRVQEAMIPKDPPRLEGLNVGGWNRPASTTGGDVYDLWETRDGRLGIFVADATGHGIAPALVVSQARALVRVLTDDAFEPSEILGRVNARLAADLESGMFVTAFLGLLSKGGELQWCSAGHGPVLVRRSSEGAIEELLPPAPPLGVLPEFLVDTSPTIQLDHGGWLAVTTDGITESWSPEKEQFGQARLTQCLEKDACRGPKGLIESLRGCLGEWQRTRDPSDDQTIVFAGRV